jgi:hypothetical protein
MKRIAILLAVALVSSVALFADEATVIDFNKLVPDTPSDKPVNNQATIVDFSTVAGSSFTDAEKAQMKTSLAIENWDVKLNTSANSVVSSGFSYTKAIKVKDTATKYAKESVLGIRAFFPTEPYNANATVKPPFEIPSYQDKDTLGSDGKLTVAQENVGKGTKFDGFGVIKNVGVLKSISVNVFGLNFPEGFSVLMKDQNNNVQEFFMGYLNFDGWRTMVYLNPNYINDVRDREIHAYPLYPNSAPLLKLEGFKVYKDASMVGGDFVGYVKDVSVVFDKALLTVDRDIDDEATWGILQTRESARRDAELKRLGVLQVDRYLEQRKMDSGAAVAPAATPAAAK